MRLIKLNLLAGIRLSCTEHKIYINSGLAKMVASLFPYITECKVNDPRAGKATLWLSELRRPMSFCFSQPSMELPFKTPTWSNMAAGAPALTFQAGGRETV